MSRDFHFNIAQSLKAFERYKKRYEKNTVMEAVRAAAAYESDIDAPSKNNSIAFSIPTPSRISTTDGFIDNMDLEDLNNSIHLPVSEEQQQEIAAKVWEDYEKFSFATEQNKANQQLLEDTQRGVLESGG